MHLLYFLLNAVYLQVSVDPVMPRMYLAHEQVFIRKAAGHEVQEFQGELLCLTFMCRALTIVLATSLGMSHRPAALDLNHHMHTHLVFQ